MQIKLWSLDRIENKKFTPTPVETISNLEAEKLLEDMIVNDPEILESGLKLIGRQTPTGGGSLDLLGTDEYGNLVVFELKKGKLVREAITQAIDYASYLSGLDRKSLCKHISEHSGEKGIEKIEDFESWYQEQFSKGIEEINERPPRIGLAGLGADDKAERMVKFLTESGLDITIVTFHAFKKDNNLFLARTERTERKVNITPKYTKESNLEYLRVLTKELKVSDLLKEVTSFFKNQWGGAYEYPLKTGYSYSFVETTEKGTPSYRAYASIYLERKKPKTVRLLFQKRAVEVAQESFKELFSKYSNKFNYDKHGGVFTYIKPEDWTEISKLLKSTLHMIKDGWEEKEKGIKGSE